MSVVGGHDAFNIGMNGICDISPWPNVQQSLKKIIKEIVPIGIS